MKIWRRNEKKQRHFDTFLVHNQNVSPNRNSKNVSQGVSPHLIAQYCNWHLIAFENYLKIIFKLFQFESNLKYFDFIKKQLPPVGMRSVFAAVSNSTTTAPLPAVARPAMPTHTHTPSARARTRATTHTPPAPARTRTVTITLTLTLMGTIMLMRTLTIMPTRPARIIMPTAIRPRVTPTCRACRATAAKLASSPAIMSPGSFIRSASY